MKKSLWMATLLIFLMVGVSPVITEPADVPRMTTDELKGMLGNPEWVILDVRYGKDWTGSDLKIQGAVREDPKAFESWANKYPKNKTIVLYCA
jgi:rhodanese-related sulfurtransferase